MLFSLCLASKCLWVHVGTLLFIVNRFNISAPLKADVLFSNKTFFHYFSSCPKIKQLLMNTDKTVLILNVVVLVLFLHNGLVEEGRTPEREVGGRSSLNLPCCVLEQDTFTSQKVLLISRKRWLRPDMTEKWLTGT